MDLTNLMSDIIPFSRKVANDRLDAADTGGICKTKQHARIIANVGAVRNAPSEEVRLTAPALGFSLAFSLVSHSPPPAPPPKTRECAYRGQRPQRGKQPLAPPPKTRAAHPSGSRIARACPALGQSSCQEYQVRPASQMPKATSCAGRPICRRQAIVPVMTMRPNSRWSRDWGMGIGEWGLEEENILSERI